MKRLVTTAGLVLIFACQLFSSDRMALARVTIYWQREGSGKSAAWNGAPLREGNCAVDPKKIPYGRKVIFDDSECTARHRAGRGQAQGRTVIWPNSS